MWALLLTVGVFSCNLPDLPPSKLTEKYGGYQNIDGSGVFYGVFRVNQHPDVMTIEAPKNLLARIVAISLNPNVFIETAVYSDPLLTDPIVFSRNDLSATSILFDLKAKTEPYYLVITYVTQVIEECLTFELKIALQTSTSVENILECKLQSHENVLPSTLIEFDKAANVGGDSFALFSKWLIGDASSLPSGVKSKAAANSIFIYEIILNIKVAGILSGEIIYDFLTNDLNLDLKQGQKSIGKSFWESLNNDELGDILNYSSSFSNIEVPPGKYSLFIKQSIEANYLVQKYSEIGICFPFAFELEFIPNSSLTSQNTVTLVDPDHLTHHNPMEPLYIRVTFLHPVASPIVYLEQIGGGQIKPKVQKLSEPNKITVKFGPENLTAGNCYELRVEGEATNDGLKHSFCMMDCMCNPKSNAICTKSMSCLCEEPYAGLSCFECVKGFFPKDSQCIEFVNEDPEVKEINFNVKSPVKKGEVVKVYVTFSSHPYESSGKKISKVKGLNGISQAFSLISTGTELFPISVFHISGGVQWGLEFDSQEFKPGDTYSVLYKPNILFDDTEKSFKFLSDFPSLSIQNSKECTHGTLIKGKCNCSKGYSGEFCDECTEGYERNSSDICLMVLNGPGEFEKDFAAYVEIISPKGQIYVDTNEKISVFFELSCLAYTRERLVIDDLTNSQEITNALFLQKKNSKRRIRPAFSRSDDGISWEITFLTEKLKENAGYFLVLADDVLFTKSGKAFAEVQGNLEVILGEEPEKVLDCSGNGRFTSKCECFEGYTSENCEICVPGYILQHNSCKKFSENEVFSILQVLLYSFLYISIGLCLIFLIRHLHKSNQSSTSEFEMVPQNISEEIDLYSPS